MLYLVGVSVLDNKASFFIKDDTDNTIEKVSKSDLKFALFNGMIIQGMTLDKNTKKIDLQL